MKQILIIDDDPEIVKIIHETCRLELPSRIESAGNGGDGLALARSKPFDLIILDLTLPDMSGIEVCKTLRAEGIETPVVCVTSRGEVIDKIVGLEVGADDYITKPFSPRELVARIKAIWRRTDVSAKASGGDGPDGAIVLHNVRVDLVSRQVFVSGNPIELSRTEFDIVELLAAKPGSVFNRDQLLEVMGYSSSGYDHSVTAHISRIRSKLEKNPDAPVYIKTVRGIGYRFATAEELEAAAGPE